MFGKGDDPSLTLLDVARSGVELDGIVGGVTSHWLVREVEESLAHRAVDVNRLAASCGRETPIEVVSRIGFGVDTRRPRAASPALRLGS